MDIYQIYKDWRLLSARFLLFLKILWENKRYITINLNQYVLRNEHVYISMQLIYNAKWVIVQLYHGGNKLHYDEMMSALY